MQLESDKIYSLKVPPASIGRTLLFSYDLIFTLPNASTIRIGRHSCAMVGTLLVLDTTPGMEIFSIGAFCEIGQNTQIILGGEHRNAMPFNLTLASGGDVLRSFMAAEDVDLSSPQPPRQKIEIGNAVVIGANCTVLEGGSVADGCVVGAGSIVSRPADMPYGIYVGAPAKLAHLRLDGAGIERASRLRIQDVATHSLPRVPSLARDGALTGVDYLSARPTVHLAGTIKEKRLGVGAVKGYSLGEAPISDPAVIERLDRYFGQIFSKPEKIEWSPDIITSLTREKSPPPA